MKLAIQRKFDPVRDARGRITGMERRPEPKPAVPLKSIGDCPVCWKPLLVAPFQQIRFHKECRKKGRKLYGKATNVVQVDIAGPHLPVPINTHGNNGI